MTALTWTYESVLSPLSCFCQGILSQQQDKNLRQSGLDFLLEANPLQSGFTTSQVSLKKKKEIKQTHITSPLISIVPQFSRSLWLQELSGTGQKVSDFTPVSNRP